MGARNPYDNFPHEHRGRSFSRDFERIDALKMDDKILVEDYKTGMVMYCYVNQLKAIDPEFGEYIKTASISEDGRTLTLTKSDGSKIIYDSEGTVRYDSAQLLSEQQKELARTNIDALSPEEAENMVDVEQRRAETMEAELQSSIEAEAERAANIESGLGNDINAEKQRAEAKEAELGNKIDGEKARAQQAESTLSTDISDERQRAQGAEFDLSARIDAIVQGRDVRDIVANYDELLAYDTSTLGDNDIIMVLLDSTKSGHTTYYKWHTATQSWEFIGGLAFTYTKTEIDEKFAALHIVLPSINEQSSQETLAQVDTMVRGAGADASFKMPIDGIGNVDVTFVKSNPAHLYLGVFADDKSILFTINRTISTPRVYSCEIVEKVFAGVSDIEELQTEIDQMKEGLAEVDGEMLVFYDYSGASVQEETLVIS